MKVIGVDGMSSTDIRNEVALRGGKFVVYQYCISVLVMTFKRPSPIYFRKVDDRDNPGLKYTLLSLLLGWWGIPWGLIWTPMTIVSNLRGGKDITKEMLAAMEQQDQQTAAANRWPTTPQQ